MTDEFPRFKAAAVQAAPVFLDKKGTVDKACRLIKEAAQGGAQLIVFPEAYIPTYPYWTSDLTARWVYVWRELFQNAVEIPGPETDALGEAARKADAYVVIGLNEREPAYSGTLYNTMVFIDRQGKIMGKHRKLVPTFHERLYWGRGDGSGIKVFDTEYGRLGGLICYEHQMTLLKYAMFAKGEQIHCALWPGWPGRPRYTIKDQLDVACRQYAFEGQVFVIVASSYIREDQVPEDFPYKKSTDWSSFGGSGIISPLGAYLAGPEYDKETIVYAEVDMGLIPLAKATVDVMGHYARWDILSLNLNEEPQVPCKPMPREASATPLEHSELRAALADLAARVNQLPCGEILQQLRELTARLEAQLDLKPQGGRRKTRASRQRR
jgi:predicted amidohydrolase